MTALELAIALLQVPNLNATVCFMKEIDTDQADQPIEVDVNIEDVVGTQRYVTLS